VAGRDYRALVVRTSDASSAERAHLVREDSEASLCGIPRQALGPGLGGELVCPDCVDWLGRRRAVTGTFSAVRAPEKPKK